jgi:alpha-L-arabinofuranosidase
MVGNRSFEGYKMNVSKPVADMVAAYFAKLDDDNRKNAENLNDDKKRFAAFEGQTIKASLTINASEKKAISDKFIGVFFEDISYAADGGLYAEMVQNRDFEYIKGEGRDKDWGPLYAWTSTGKLTLSSDNPLSLNNPHHIIVTGDTLYNSGWDGMKVVSGEHYDFSFFVCPKDVKTKRFTVALVDGANIIAKARIKTKGKSDEWNKYEAELVATANAKSARLMLIPEGKGSVALDMISLFPHETFCHRKNGLRKDLAQAIADLKPRFIRFPGGCMTHGDGLDNIYHWHHTVGPLHERKPDTNIWRYHQTRGLGFYEYFQYCEDIGAEPLPVLAAGVPCQNSAANEHGYGGQQGGVPMEHMQAYIQEFLDLIEWANGNPATSKWAKMRADAGHPEPFNLKYIGVGNEDLVSTVFEERCLMISKAIKEKYPDIILCGTVGPFHAPSSDYVEGWKFANQHRDVFDMVDEHYYESVGWFLNNQHYYDNYDRTGPKVYLGEYAARVGKGGVDCALAEAVHLCNVERNADVVTMTSYAPLLSKNGHSNWSPDMMYFDNHRVDKTPSYYTQWLFGNYAGDNYISSVLKTHEAVANRIAASVVTDSKTGKRYLRIVNVLPVQVALTLDGSLPVAATLKWQGFSGKPGQQRVKLLQGEMPANNIVLPPYSFYVMEI